MYYTVQLSKLIKTAKNSFKLNINFVYIFQFYSVKNRIKLHGLFLRSEGFLFKMNINNSEFKKSLKKV
jgi:hypothetical protein